MINREPQPITPQALELIIERGDPQQICSAMVDGVHSIADSDWLENWCLRLLRYDNLEVQGIAITCIGHLARLHGKIDLARTVAAFTNIFRERPNLRGRIDDAVDDIRVFMKVDIKVNPGNPTKKEK